MDNRIRECPNLTDIDIEFLRRVEAALPITADVCRADITLCCKLDDKSALIARHMRPKSTSSLYRQNMTGSTLTEDDQPILFRTFASGNIGRGQKEVLASGAPVIQDCYPIYSESRRMIGALVYETNMVAHERHRRRNRHFRQAAQWLQSMCISGELSEAATLSRFGLHDGIYLVNRNRKVVYMNGIVANLFRSIGIVSDIREQAIDTLEAFDQEMVDEAFHTQMPAERRHESDDGRIWIRKVVPLRMAPVTWQNYWQNWTWYGALQRNDHPDGAVESVMVMIHNATEAVQKQRELNVKSAIIKEVHHRVKNNLQTVAAILRIQARRTENDEAKQLLTDAVNRILSMSVIHEFLSHDEHQPINVSDVCQRIANQVADIAASPGQRIDVHVSGPNIRLPAGQATPIALVINELMLNAVEHGVKEREHAIINIRLEDEGGNAKIILEDDGDGLPDDFDPADGKSLGLQIVHTLVTDDLKGHLEMVSYEELESSFEDNSSANEESKTGQLEASRQAPGSQQMRSGTRAIVTIPKQPLKAS